MSPASDERKLKSAASQRASAASVVASVVAALPLPSTRLNAVAAALIPTLMPNS